MPESTIFINKIQYKSFSYLLSL
jgi:hypothetical protein